MSDPTYHLLIADELLTYAATLPCDEAKLHVELAVAALELFLNLPPALLSLHNELQARLVLSRALFKYTTNIRQAEEIILKGQVKIQNQEHLVEYKLAFNELLCRILRDSGSLNAAKRLIKDSIVLCSHEGRGLEKWHYIFLFTSFEMEKSLSSVRALRAFAAKRQNLSVLQIADLLDSIIHITQGLPLPDAISPSLPSAPQTLDTSQLTITDYMHLAVSVLGDVLAGNVARTDQQEEITKRALSKLGIIHQGLDARPNFDHVLRIPVPENDLPHSSADILMLTSFSTRRFMIFMYVLSGLVHLAEITSNRSEKFLLEGKKQLLHEIQDCGNDAWTGGMMELIHVYAGFNHLLHSRLESVSTELSLARKDSDLVRFLKGCLAQQVGKLDDALNLYSTITDGELSILACLNTILVYCGSLKADQNKAKDLLLKLEERCGQGPLRTSFELVKCVLTTGTSIALKRALTGVLNAAKLQANTQFNIIALSILSVTSSDPDEMKLKFSSYALSQANKSASVANGVNIWSHLNGTVVENILRNQAMKSKLTSEQYTDKMNKIRQMNSDTADKLQSSLPLVSAAISRGA
ncbi:Sister chromatid cohesion protein ssl35 / FY16936)) [Taphrina deformans PYCC 5710]|uniref:Sister chromatid cohesion protein ssl35 / FY16936 n=1 Tax=Taphrina deformans (strain PYCC 5710 / ATCC 11124 / CBS 356.35 / IMI 108563 / JCM 9778 / NBRC 8474) TaxID=1097556 RepID=R4X8Y3_TAPDE|nr:Sister chromatid cohesion protein ssl35 / FY16936)) [Taphrina deformans PYCC 5710]|eukprot:CCG82124.1 Sister chromatid cohesion protein ssl35 / FY16936)) [Taphrina deformans PYCC 5710]